MRKLISSGSTFEKDIGYSRAVVDGDWCFVSGTTGYDYDKMEISDDVVAQAEQCFKNIAKALEQGGFTLADTVRVHYLLPQASDFEKCWPVTRKYFGDIRPAATMFEARLASPAMKIEIEVTAKKSS
ncbi:RidA family protein [Aestuariivirga litoralis]|uniref:RidA family protein n=1 Tax=Aestuariivirga litoralis TaxID=2650924 RepID=UPI0018C7AA5B|nr:RidA family protein [Aestuariivirga litoralis]MBG1231868.1 RidA family protein [Aestuariivirga litoralis]